MCSALHKQYPDFGAAVVKAFATAATPPPRTTAAAALAAEADAASGVPRRRIVLRLLAALLTVGVGDSRAAAANVDGVKGPGTRPGVAEVQGWQLLTDALKQLSVVDFRSHLTVGFISSDAIWSQAHRQERIGSCRHTLVPIHMTKCHGISRICLDCHLENTQDVVAHRSIAIKYTEQPWP